MKTNIPKKYILISFAFALFIGCIAGSSMLYNPVAFGIALIFVLLLLFINWKNKRRTIVPILFLTLLWGSFQYDLMAAKKSSLMDFEGRSAVVEGIVADEPVKTEYGQKFTLKSVYYVNNNRLFKSNEKLLVYGKEGMAIEFGDKIKMTAEIEKSAISRNFGDFDFNRYYQSKNIFMRAYPQKLTKTAVKCGGTISQFLYSCRQNVKETIYSAMPDQEAAILYGILTGSKGDIDEDVLQVFSKTGLAHILSVSGLHIGFLVLIIGYILKPLKLKDKIKYTITFLTVLFYILLIGAPVPALRALLMFSVMLGGKLWGQNYDLNSSASFAAILLLLYNPLLIHDPSFIISFACIYAISFFHQSINNKLVFLPTWLRSSLSLSLAVWIGITPVLIYYFNYVSIINIVLNVAAVPLAFLITISGFAATVIGILIPALSAYIFSASYYMIKLLFIISERSLLLPGTGFNAPSFSWYGNLLYYGAALVIIEDFWKNRGLRFKRLYLGCLTASIAVAVALNVLPMGSLRLNFVDVGQGDCSVIRTPYNKTILIDGGGNASWQSGGYDIGQKITAPALLHLGVWRLDTVIVSHIHDDHIGGVLSAVEKFKVGRVILPKTERYGEGEYASDSYNKLVKLCKAKGIPISYLKKGDKIALEKDFVLEILGPEKPYILNTESDVNNNSLVIKLKYKSFDALFTGDIQQEAEHRLAEESTDIDVLKVAHHGSPYSSTKELLDLIKPEISIISVGRNNYGHPSKEVLERLREAGSVVYRTDSSGGVMLRTDGVGLKIKTVR